MPTNGRRRDRHPQPNFSFRSGAAGRPYDRRVRRSVALVALVLVVLGSQAPRAGAAKMPRRLPGSLTLVNVEAWKRTGRHGCEGAGLYGDVERGTAVAVLDLSGHEYLRTELGAGRRVRGPVPGCRFAFVLRRLPPAPLYHLVIGPEDNIVYQDLLTPNDARVTARRLEFVIGAPASAPTT